MKGFKSKDLPKLTGVNQDTLGAWLREGLIISSIRGTEGRGSTRLYSHSDVILISAVVELTRLSFNRKVVKAFSKYYKDRKDKKHKRYAWSDGNHWHGADTRDSVCNAIGYSPIVILIDLDQIEKDTGYQGTSIMNGKTKHHYKGTMKEKI